ncbi:hypothetical protein CHF27_001040 [Romboutsia maritimum]|uniref:Uncharacterized protein n=2 Tax=Romboutsia maritimum TaxID=2020948 RepID=A0A371IX40_9FIRM|nr:hypothetical protein CHF27_001040 [Romboutsia maritimum]
MIAMSIVLLIGTICFPKYSIEKYHINSFTKQLCSDIRYVRRSNMLGDGSVYILWTFSSGYNGYVLKNNKKNIKEISIPSNIKINPSIIRVKFRTDGSLEERGGKIKIFGKKVYKEITIVPISGRTLLKEGKYEV